MLLFKALILGIVEGLTEFLPVSSTGHLIVAADFLDYPPERREMFEVFIQFGAILAVVWHYRTHLLDVARRATTEPAARGLVLNVVLAFLPAALVGVLMHDWIEEYLFSTVTVAAALVVGGFFILWIERRPHAATVARIEDVSWRQALWTGIAQILSLFPGVSRAGATIIGSLLVGLDRPTATQFSFYLALPTVSAASLFSLLKRFDELNAADVPPLAVGFAAAFVSALLVIRGFIRFVQSHDFTVFGYYRIAAGLLLLALA